MLKELYATLVDAVRCADVIGHLVAWAQVATRRVKVD